MRNVAVLGSTGSIGTSTLDVIESDPGSFRAVALAARENVERLEEQAARVRPQWVVVTDAEASRRHAWNLPRGTELLTGTESVEQVVASADVDLVVSAIVGAAGLRGTWAALEAGKIVALANKETMVVAGPLITALAKERNTRIVPIDSEHSGVFQALQAGGRDEVRRVVLTASGGPFRKHTAEQLARVTVEEALAHPTWTMGRKITVDSATMMNKALEIIEARWLFDLAPEQIGVVVHPQSIVHALVEFVDGSVVAQMSPPDMRLPIQYALTYPRRQPGIASRFDWSQAQTLEFEPPDFERFPALRLGLEAARAGGTTGAVLNAANEAAVGLFLTGKLAFNQIVAVCERVLAHHTYEARASLARLLELDRWARQEVDRWSCS